MEIYVRRRKSKFSFQLFAIFAIGFVLGFVVCYVMPRGSNKPNVQPPGETAVNTSPPPTTGQQPPRVSVSGEVVPPPTTPSELENLQDIWPARHLFITIKGTTLDDATKAQLAKVKPGGIVLTSENVKDAKQAKALVASIKDAVGLGKDISDLPLIAVDIDSDVVAKLGATAVPSPPELGAKRDLELAQRAGATVGQACADAGVGVLFGPSLDIFENGASPDLQAHTFGKVQGDVIALAIAFADGVAASGVAPIVKHYPGLGSSPQNLNDAVAVLPKDNINDVATVIFPFQEAARVKVPGMLAGHISVKILDPTNAPASQSASLISDNIRTRWLFLGAVLADDLSLGAISKTTPVEQAAVQALKADCDGALILNADPGTIDAVSAAINAAVDKGDITRAQLREAKGRLESLRAWIRERKRLEGTLPTLPKEDKNTPPQANTESPAPGEAVTYEVQHGDTLTKIAAKFKVTQKQIVEWNNLKSREVRLGQKLKIYPNGGPAKPAETTNAPTAEQPTPKAADQTTPAPGKPSEPSKQAPTPEVKQPDKPAQPEKPAAQSPADSVPPTAQPPDSEPPKETATTPPAGTKALSYTVKSGDFLATIAKRYGVKYQDIMEWNALTDIKLQVGQVLVINVPENFKVLEEPKKEEPKKDATPATTSTTPSADASAATPPATTPPPATPPAATPLAPAPDPAQPAPTTPTSTGDGDSYTVQKGDFLSKIAKANGVSVENLRTWNSLADDHLKVGQVLKLKAPTP